jgi:Flp pilus assembly protein TadG
MARKARHGFWGISQRLWRDDRGATLVLMALTTTVLLAITGLAVDTGWWYTIQRQNQSAADAGALSAAYELLPLTHQAWTAAQLTPFASQAATQNGYAGTAPAVTYPCGSPPCLAQNSGGIQVVLQQPQNTWFAALTGLNSVTITNRAVAKVVPLDSPCSYVMNPTADKAFSITGSATMSSPGCSICVDSNKADSIYMQGGNNAVLTADSIITAGGIATTGQPTFTLKYPAQVGAPPCPDPFASTLTHSFLTTGMPTTPACTVTGNSTNNVTVSGSCSVAGTGNTISPKNGGTVNLAANTEITGGFNIKNETVNLAPGTYWITDGNLALGSNSTLECTACVPGGAGVTIILTTSSTGPVGNVTQQANAVVDNLNAPGSGTFQNLLLIQDSNGLGPPFPFTSGGSTFQGTPGQTLNGLVYFPDSALTFQGNPAVGNSSCLLTVANTLTLAGNASVSATTGCPTSGPGGVKKIFTVALVE